MKTKSLSAQVASIEDPIRRNEVADVAINALLEDYARAEAKGQTSYMNYIAGELRRLGHDSDYNPVDSGEYYELKTNE